MPNAIFEVELPDGKILEIEAPANTNPDAIKQRARQYHYETLKAELDRKNGTDGLDPTEGMSGYDKFMAGAGKSVHDTGRGLQQLWAMAADKLSPRARSMSDLVTGRDPGRLAEITREVDRDRQLDAPLMRTGAGKTGYVTGTIASLLTPGVALKAASKVPQLAHAAQGLNLASRAFLPDTVAGTAIQGGVFGAMQPVGTGDSRALNAGIGMAAGAGGAALPRIAGAGMRVARAPFAGMTASGAEKRVADTLRREAVDTAALSRAAPSAIPGVQRTLAEESLDPGIAILQRGVFARTPEAAVTRANNNAARVAALRGFAGDDAAVAAAETARNAATKPLREQAMKAGGVDTSRLLARLDRTTAQLQTRPAVQKPLAEVANLLRREIPEKERMGLALDQVANYLGSGARRSAADHDAVTQVAKAIRMRGQTPDGALEIIKGIKPQSVAAKQAVESAKKLLAKAEAGRDDVASLYNVRKSIDDMLAGRYGGEANFAKAAASELMVIKNGLDRAIAKQSPEFGQYLSTYRDMSRGIDRMKLGQTLLEDGAGNKIFHPTTGELTLTPAAFGRQAADLDRAAVNATGFRNAQAGNILRPEDMATIGNIQDDLSRQAFADTAAAGPNSTTFQNMATNAAVQGQKSALQKIPMVGAMIDIARKYGDDNMQQVLEAALRNPSEARRILGAFPAEERRVIENALFRLGAATGATALPAHK